MSVDAQILVNKYKQSLVNIISLIRDQKGAAIPVIISTIVTDIVPSMMTTVGKVKSLSGHEKRDLIIEAIDLSIDEVFEELNKIPELAEASWDDKIHEYIDMLLPSVIKLLISVENNEIKFNKKVAGCFSCCK